MSGIDPATGEEICYPGEGRSRFDRLWNGSSMHGGGLSQLVGPLLFLAAVAVLAFGCMGAS